MIYYIKGIVDEILDDGVVLECNDIGYKICMTHRDIQKLQNQIDKVKIYTYQQIKEDENVLYGFLNKEELNIFKMLISISGVGPKAAVSILSTVTASDFILAVVTNNEKMIVKAQGVGKKTAQRIILELKDKFKDVDLTQREQDEELININGLDENEAIGALMALGYSRKEAFYAVSKVLSQADSLEDIIKLSLKVLMKG
ncbi:MAG: Holliday junction branch migration protein RuvA [Caloramator sp.]|nr:Holliday junction branch migration protein RuvA [Caloramator sp.]